MISDNSSGAMEVAGNILERELANFGEPEGDDLAEQCEPFARWLDRSRAVGRCPYIPHHASARDVMSDAVGFGGQRYQGSNLASQDYLGLSRHPEVIDRAVAATQRYGTHSAGSDRMGGGLDEAEKLSAAFQAFTGLEKAVLFPTGWGASYGAIKAFIRSRDPVVIDALTPGCPQIASSCIEVVYASWRISARRLERKAKRRFLQNALAKPLHLPFRLCCATSSIQRLK